MAGSGDDSMIDPLVGTGPRLAGKNPDRRAPCRLRSARNRRHDLVPAAAHDRRTTLGEQSPDGFGSILVVSAAPDHRDLDA